MIPIKRFNQINEGIVTYDNVKKEKIEGQILDIILLYLNKHSIKKRSEFKKECSNLIEEVIDIWSEIKYDFPQISIKFEKYKFETHDDSNIQVGSVTKHHSQFSSDIYKYVRVTLSQLYPYYLSNDDLKNVSYEIDNCLRRCTTFSKIVRRQTSISNPLLCSYTFTGDFKYEFYNIYNNNETLVIEFFKTSEYDRDDRLSMVLKDLSNLRDDLRKIGYGILLSYGSDIRIEVFKLKSRDNED